MTNYTNTLTSDDQLLETPLVSSTDDTPPDSNLLLFQRRNNTYNLRNFQEFATKKKRTVKIGLETLICRSPQLWSTLPKNLRQINSLVQFKESVRK